MAGVQASAALGSFLQEHEERIVKRASRDLKVTLGEGTSRQERKVSVPSLTGRLASLLLERGDDTPRLWAEEVRHHGKAYFDARRDVADLVRELGTLHRAILEEWEKRAGTMTFEVAELLEECISEGSASAVADYVRRARGEQVEFRESALIHTLLENLDEGLLLVEGDGTFSFATRAAFNLLGGRVHGALGRPITDPAMEALLKEIRARTLEGAPVGPSDLPAAQTLRSGKPCEVLLMQARNDGVERVLELGAVPIWNEGDERHEQVRGVIMTVRDRTVEARRSQELKEANRELADLHARLLHRSRTQAMGELASGAAHALNNLLNTMHLRLRLLRENPGPEQVDALERAVSDTARLVAWLQQFSSQRTAGPVEAVDLDALVKEAIALVRPEARRTGEGAIRLAVKPGNLPRVRANPSELREILVSLLLYVRDQIGAGGQLEVTTGVEPEGILCHLAFCADVGAPARPEEWMAPVPEAGPAALALAAMTAREMLSRWGGGLESRSIEAGGAEFVLSFSPAVTVAIPSPGPSKAEPYHCHVLVIDDDEDNAAMLAEVLATEGHFTDTAGTGRQAIDKWKQGPFDVALVDLLMPDMSGMDIAASLRRAKPSARIALVTGWELDDEQRRAAPVQRVFRKPVDLGQLLGFLGPEETAAPAP